VYYYQYIKNLDILARENPIRPIQGVREAGDSLLYEPIKSAAALPDSPLFLHLAQHRAAPDGFFGGAKPHAHAVAHTSHTARP
jgi:hypothetical protein